MMNTNAKSIFLASRAVGKIMIRQRSGKLINISSILGDRPLPASLHYGASKAAVINMTKALALEWARFKINVNGIAPGYFVTEMTKEQQEGEIKKLLLTKIPFGRFGSSDEIVGLAVFLASPACRLYDRADRFYRRWIFSLTPTETTKELKKRRGEISL